MKRIFFTLMAVFCCALPAVASTMQVRVVEVLDGKTIIAENTGRKFKIVLKLAEAPEADQPYGDVARRHLATLVMNRPAAAEFMGLGGGAIIIARVYCDGRDVGLQMIRDGVAWYDRKNDSDLNEADRRVYADSEQAARNERRGIWQDAAPVPPWEWRQFKNAATGPGAAATSGSPSVIKTASSVASPNVAAKSAARKDSSLWPVFSPTGAPFSVRMPGGGKYFTAEISVPNAMPFTANFYWTDHLRIGYVAAWASGPHNGEAITKLFDRARDALNQAAAAFRLPCEFIQEKDVSLNGYTGQRYRVSGCHFQGALRYYFKVEGKMMKARIVGVMSEIPNDPSINQFLDSFEIN